MAAMYVVSTRSEVESPEAGQALADALTKAGALEVSVQEYIPYAPEPSEED